MPNIEKPVLNLRQFLLKQDVKRLYRRILKTIRQIPNDTHRVELKNWARSDFRNNAHHTDEMTIKMLINYGERSLKELQTSINLAK